MNIGLGGMDPNALQKKALEAAEKIGRGQGESPVGPITPGEEDVAKFNEIIQPADDTAQPPPAVTLDGAVPGQGAEASEPASLGDRILKGMSSASDKIQAGRADAAKVLEKGEVNQADLLRANFSLQESSTLISAVSKTTEKITQSVKTLQQG